MFIIKRVLAIKILLSNLSEASDTLLNIFLYLIFGELSVGLGDVVGLLYSIKARILKSAGVSVLSVSKI